MTQHAPIRCSDVDLAPPTISEAFLAGALNAYRTHARYLKSAKITHLDENAALPDAAHNDNIMSATGRFSIPVSCLYVSGGHFCAVEFNICYQQLACVVFGKCVEAGLMPGYPSFPHGGCEPPPIAIACMEGVRFLKQVQSDDFQAALTITRICFEGSVCLLFTSIAFSDREGLKAKGSVVLTFTPASGIIGD
jgi:hypothetical protein